MNLLQVAVFLVNFSLILSLEKEKVREVAKQMLLECQNQEGASNEDLEKIVQEELPGTVEGNCMMACAYELVEIFIKGKFKRDHFMQMAKMLVENDKELMDHAALIADNCGTVQGERCDQALEFTKCLHEAVNTYHADVQLV